MATNWDLGTAMQTAWERTSEQLGVLVGSTVIVIGVQVAFSLLDASTDLVAAFSEPEEPGVITIAMSLVSMGISLVSALIGLWLSLGLNRIALDAARGEDAKISDLFGQTAAFPVALIAVIIGAAAASAGFCLFIVPGIIVGLGLEMSTLLIVDQRVGPFEALTESWRLMDGEKLELFALWIVLGLANLVGLCLCGLPWLILLPFGTVCQAWIYNQLVEAKGAFAASGA